MWTPWWTQKSKVYLIICHAVESPAVATALVSSSFFLLLLPLLRFIPITSLVELHYALPCHAVKRVKYELVNEILFQTRYTDTFDSAAWHGIVKLCHNSNRDSLTRTNFNLSSSQLTKCCDDSSNNEPIKKEYHNMQEARNWTKKVHCAPLDYRRIIV